MKLNESSGKTAATYAVILGVAYIALGLLEFIEGFGDFFAITGERILGIQWIPVDIFGGIMTIIIGLVYFGAIPLWKAKYESLSFLLVGALLSAVFGALYLIIVAADGFGTVLALIDGEEWTWEWLTAGTAGTGLLRPEIWLFFLSLPLVYFAWSATKAK